MTTPQDSFHYSGQIRRFLTQFIRMMSNFYVEMGSDEQGNSALQRVPAFYGNQSRQAAAILQGNSENMMPTVPAIGVYISGLKYDRDRMQQPSHVSKLRIREQVYDQTTGEYIPNRGDIYTVERLMPAPYTLTLKVDIWVSNENQRHQLIEQISPIFNPGLEVQNTDNYVDWTSLSVVYLNDTVYDSRSVPMGNTESISITSYAFEMPIWLSPPAKVKKMGIVHKIIASIYDDAGNLVNDIADVGTLLSRKVIAPMNYGVLYVGNTLTLLKPSDTVSHSGIDHDTKIGTKVLWRSVIDMYGVLRNGITQVRLTNQDNSGTEIVGTVSYHPTDDSVLIFTPFDDTLPANSLQPIAAIIDPLNVTVDSSILTPTVGTRYLILEDIGHSSNTHPSIVWQGVNGGLVAKANDIIEYTASGWDVVFTASSEQDVQYVTNLRTGIQYRWVGTHWTKSVEGHYNSGEWSLVID